MVVTNRWLKHRFALLLRTETRPDRRQHYDTCILHLPHLFARAAYQFTLSGWNFLAGQSRYCFRWEDFRHAIRNFSLGGKLFGDYFDNEIPSDAGEFDSTVVYSCFQRSCQKQRLMTTTKVDMR